MLKTPCTSQECSWNKGKKRNKNPRTVSDATYPSKRSRQTLSVFEFDPRPARYREVNEQHVNKFLSNIQALVSSRRWRNFSCGKLSYSLLTVIMHLIVRGKKCC